MISLGNTYATASGRLQIARRRMATDYPFHATLLADSRFECAPSINTMAVTVRAASVTILYNPDFVLACSWDELCGVLHHEVNHVILGHIHQTPDEFPDRQALVIAQEVTANEFVREPLPGRPITLQDIPDLPPGESTPQRYRRLCTRPSSGLAGPMTAGICPQKGKRLHPKTASGGPENGDLTPKNGPAGPENGSAEPDNLPPTLDDHAVWEEVRREGALGRLSTAVAIDRACRPLTPKQWQILAPHLREAIRQTVAGLRSGNHQEPLERCPLGATVRWQHLLHRFVGESIGQRESFSRPPRRFPQLLGIVPGSTQWSARPIVLAAIDTSGSLSRQDLSRIAAELDRLARWYEVIVVQCDTRIHNVSRYHGLITDVRGRGGTDLRPPLSRRFLQRHRADLVVFFTDGFGPAPANRPARPVVWCLTAKGQRPARYGRAVWMR
jgi:predicted metal-dependent peptidase